MALRDFQVALGTALTDSAPVTLADGRLTVEMPAAFCSTHADDPTMVASLASLIERIAGCALQVALRPRPSTQGDGQGRLYRAAAEHPLVQELLRRFEADVLARENMTAEMWRSRHAGK